MRIIKDERLGRTWSYYLSYIALGLAIAIVGPTLPSLAEQTGAQLSQISFLFTAQSLGGLIGSYQGGRLYDRVPGHPVMAGAVLLVAAMLALVPMVPFLWLLTMTVFLLGLAGSVIDVGGNALVVWVHGRNVGPFMNGLHFFFGFGAFIAPLVVAQALNLTGGVRGAYWFLALVMVPLAAFLLRWSSPKAPGEQGEEAENADSSARAGARSSSRDRLIVILIALFLLVNVGAELGFGGWIYTYALAQGLGTETTAAYLTSIFWGALTVGRLLSIPISLRVQPRYVLLGDLIGCLLSIGVLLIWPHSWTATVVGAAGLGLSMASVFPTTISFAEGQITITGRITGWFIIGSSLGSMVLPWLIGQLFEPVGPPVTMVLILGALVAALAVFGVLMLFTRRTVLSQEPGV